MPRSSRPGGAPSLRQRATRRVGTYFTRHAQNLFGSLGRLLRQPLANGMTVAVIAIALTLPTALHLLVVNAKSLGGRWQSAFDVSAYLTPGLTDAEARAVAGSIRSRADVSGVEYVPPDAALDEFRASFGAALDALTENPLPGLLIVRPAEGHQTPEGVDAITTALAATDGVDLVQLDTDWVRRFHALLDILHHGVNIAAAILALGVLLIVGNTIRLDIENRRDEIEIAKLIGASDGFIRRPFLYSGFWYGVFGGLLALGLVTLGIGLLQEPVHRIAGLYGSDFRLEAAGLAETAAVIGGGACLGWVGSWVAAARHLRAINPD